GVFRFDYVGSGAHYKGIRNPVNRYFHKSLINFNNVPERITSKPASTSTGPLSPLASCPTYCAL
ncbi:hypothetical protein NJI34_34015, partial [Pseudomonas sp. S 311-6]|uniref:hypothetical protein n=1 Tax=Pseudomonas TaxID=286 RepID=UPI002097462F